MSPDRLQQVFAWQNRINDWRALGAQSVFLGVAGGAFVVMFLMIADPFWSRLLAANSPWAREHVSGILALMLAITVATLARRRAHNLALLQRSDWLAALPIDPQIRQDFRRRSSVLHLALNVAAALLLLAWGQFRSNSGAYVFAPLLALGCAAGLLLGWRSANVRLRCGQIEPMQRPLAAAIKIVPGTEGLDLLGAAIEPGLARLPRSARWVAFALLLLPVGMPLMAIFVIVLLIGSLGQSVDLIRHWRERYRIDLRWLAAQPLAPRRLLGAYLRPMTRRALLLDLIFAASVLAAGAPLWFATMAALVLATAMAHAILCSYATRDTQRGFTLLMSTHYLCMFATAQILPFVLPIAALACALHAWRRGEALS